MQTCSVIDCSRPEYARTWCTKHYQRWLTHRDPTKTLRVPPPTVCAIEGCDKPWHARVWCVTHYARWQRHGDPNAYLRDYPDTCSVDGCARPFSAKGFCKHHYSKWYKHGDALWERPPIQLVCSIEGCDKPFKTKGLCSMHGERLRIHGDPLHVTYRPTAHERFLAKVVKTDTCWLWQGSHTRQGHGTFNPHCKTIGAHRYSYEHYVGPIPESLDVDHMCRVPACVNPKHLEPVTKSENQLRAHLSAKDHYALIGT